jgi:hypothetical protein
MRAGVADGAILQTEPKGSVGQAHRKPDRLASALLRMF